ncbi:unnamed protein product [Protopolystoma xenopodis]|uniref:Uncharacterized protein n=1 Tax=Protopolystoma xenopodis TaxID=117903 RepID=A0A3S5AKE5_9PLAT|nr:unnamed protein product [Protopolystoma xenopodis]
MFYFGVADFSELDFLFLFSSRFNLLCRLILAWCLQPLSSGPRAASKAPTGSPPQRACLPPRSATAQRLTRTPARPTTASSICARQPALTTSLSPVSPVSLGNRRGGGLRQQRSMQLQTVPDTRANLRQATVSGAAPIHSIARPSGLRYQHHCTLCSQKQEAGVCWLSDCWATLLLFSV